MTEPTRLQNQFEELFLELQAESMRIFASELLSGLYDSGFSFTQLLYGLVDHFRSTNANEQLVHHLEQAAQHADVPDEGEGTDLQQDT
jgi:hypothetical protein